MIVVLKQNPNRHQLESLIAWLQEKGIIIHTSIGEAHTILGLVGDTSQLDIDLIAALDIVEDVKRVQEPYKNANRKFHPEDTVVKVGNTQIGGGSAPDIMQFGGNYPDFVDRDVLLELEDYKGNLLQIDSSDEFDQSVLETGSMNGHLYGVCLGTNTLVLAYNKTMLDEADVPTTWEGLCNENLKGKIAYCSPSKSGSAYTQLCTMLFSQPTIEEGWDLVGKFIANLDGKLQDSSGNCHKLVASGEYALGVTIEKSAVLYADNPDIGFVYPEQNSAVPDGVALIKDCPNEENAKLFIDFVTSAECQTAQNADWARRPVRSDITPKGLCSLEDCHVGNYDFSYAASHRDEIKEQFNDLVAG